MKICLAVFALSLVVPGVLIAQSGLVGKNLFPEGGFEISGESADHPLGWQFPDRNDVPWKNGFRAEVVPGEGDGNELRIVRPDPAGTTIVSAKVSLPAKIERLRVSYRIRSEELTLGEEDPAGNGAGIFLRFKDAEGNNLRGGGWVGGQAKVADPDWQEREAAFPMPPEAKELELHVIFRSAAGEVRVDDVEMVPLTVGE